MTIFVSFNWLFTKKTLLHPLESLLCFFLPFFSSGQLLSNPLGVSPSCLLFFSILFLFTLLFIDSTLLSCQLCLLLFLFLLYHSVILHRLPPDGLTPSWFNLVSLSTHFIHFNTDHILSSL